MAEERTAAEDPAPAREPGFLVLGESLVDVVRDRHSGRTAEHPGGSPANVAVALSRLGHRVELLTAVGPDARGALVTGHLEDAGVELAADPVILPRTSTALATLDESGAATYDFEIAGDLPLLGSAGHRTHLHTGSLAALLPPGCDAIAAAVAEHADRCTVSYDVNARPQVTGTGPRVVEGVERMARLSDVVKASDEDLATLYPDLALDDAVARLLGLGPTAVVLTEGGAGARCVTAAGSLRVPARRVDVVDTIGAGDTFCAGLLDGLLAAGCLGVDGRPRLRSAPSSTWYDALDRAAAAAAVAVSRAGAAPPDRAELDAQLAAGLDAGVDVAPG